MAQCVGVSCFFFQAEDGIRDIGVTGVQTCALPICLSDFYFGGPYSWLVTAIGSNPDNSSEFYVYNLDIDPTGLAELSYEDLVQRLDTRSEKRRVGKEGRSRGSPDH